MKLKTKNKILFLFDCPKYFITTSIPRDELNNKVHCYVDNIKQLPPKEGIKELTDSFNYFVNLQLMKFVLSFVINICKFCSVNLAVFPLFSFMLLQYCINFWSCKYS